ncbi:Cytochrome oxidase maturation protein cbb3-type [Grimontia celer]|uniref:Cytochrome oxidase maturation protein cbb3-type n=1 Tax=Grimontia celer TaxID=1796497 RepID=A0A128EWG4_9GAMM|nr:cbb3-type cytochrome oxidase assembly protein CcoS [Grimontia celer]CZF78899.1 Cytochrome oxidase maturation protein cbb3-type [Grimontia celer]
MESLYILIPIAIVLVCVAVGIFIWAVKSEQFEDLERQGMNILLDEDESTPPSKKPSDTSSEQK